MRNLLRLMIVCLALTACKAEEKRTDLIVETENGSITYYVDNAQTDEQLTKGLMFVEEMPENVGMIFDLTKYAKNPETPIAMWMKNTIISLDMIFTDDEGKIVWIHENATPMSEETIASPVYASYVLELNAGQAEEKNIKIGDQIRHIFFGNM